jgi:hypothetical protein
MNDLQRQQLEEIAEVLGSVGQEASGEACEAGSRGDPLH